MNWKKAVARLPIAGCLLLLAGCEMIDYHPYDVRIKGETGVNGKNIAQIEAEMAGRRHLRFAMISDTQRWYDETEEAVAHINRQGSVDFVIHGGDQADFGMTQEFLWMRDILGGLTRPYVCVIYPLGDPLVERAFLVGAALVRPLSEYDFQ